MEIPEIETVRLSEIIRYPHEVVNYLAARHGRYVIIRRIDSDRYWMFFRDSQGTIDTDPLCTRVRYSTDPLFVSIYW